jgi:hypothetical protein
MASTFTPNVGLEEPARGDDVGVWDLPVNSNTTVIDLLAGAIATIGLNNSNVVLSAAQFRSKQITFNSTLTGSVIITFPTSFTKSYEIQHACTGSSAFTITLATTAGGQVIAVPPGETIDCFNDGVNIKFKNLGRIGEYCDYAGTAVPNWVSACTIPPYLNCNATTFSSATYPTLTTLLGGTTLPDSRGRARYAADAGTARITSVIANANTVGSGGGDQNLQAHTHANTLNDPTHAHSYTAPNTINAGGSGPFASPSGIGAVTGLSATGMTITNASAGAGAAQNMPPVYIGGITMIRAA